MSHPGRRTYLGDLSSQDAALLAEAAQHTQSILEFGVGASSQIFAQCAPPHAQLTSLDTSAEWIARTATILQTMGLQDRVRFRSYAEWTLAADENCYDLLFDDGADELRLDFAHRAWPRLKVGGKLIFHDTRRPRDYVNVLRFAAEHYLEISAIEANPDASNLSFITKQLPLGYENWNMVEGRSPVMIGWGSVEESIAFVAASHNRPA
jgi:Methyltransferase domain